MEIKLYDWPRTTGPVAGHATFRGLIEDFQVTETLRFEPSGEGAHHLLFIEKRNLNTDKVCQKLQQFADVHSTDVGYAGKKDRFAVAKQWFSVQLPLLREIDWNEFNDDEVQVLQVNRHGKKLRIGAVKSNVFKIVLRDFEGDRKLLESKIIQIENEGFANYFGEQRFGYNGNNLSRGVDILEKGKRLKDRSLQGLLFSSVRSFLFNHQLSERINREAFTQLWLGDYVQLEGSESGFRVEDLEKEIDRFNEKDIHPTAALPGRGREQNSDQSFEFEAGVLQEFQSIIEKLERKGLNADRRSIRVFPQNITYSWHNETKADLARLELNFELPKGAFATSFLRELADLRSL